MLFVKLRFLVAVLFFTCVSTSFFPAVNTSIAKTENAHENQDIDFGDVQKAVHYLNNLRDVKSKFTQISNEGSQLTGDFYLSRPGKLRFEYNEIDDFIVADGTFIYYYDSILGEQSNALIGSTLADFILRDEINVDRDIAVKSTEHRNGFLIVDLIEKEKPEAGMIRLAFTEKPFKLHMWRVIDAMGKITDIYLDDINREPEFRDRLFVYSDPNRFKNRYNR